MQCEWGTPHAASALHKKGARIPRACRAASISVVVLSAGMLTLHHVCVCVCVCVCV